MRERDQLARLGHGLGHGLLDQHVRAGGQEIAGDLEMRRRRRDDAYGIDLAEQLAIVGMGGNVKSGATASRASGGGRRCATSLQSAAGVLLGVKTAEVANADDGGSDFFHGAAIMPARSAASPKVRASPTMIDAACREIMPSADVLARHFGTRWRSQSRLRRETHQLWGRLLFGLLVMPLLIWPVGSRVLGPYTPARILTRALSP